MTAKNPFALWDDESGFDGIPPITDPGGSQAQKTLSTITVTSSALVSLALIALTPTQVTSATSPLVINLDWDLSVASAPAAFITAVIAAARYLESQFTDAITINLAVGYNEVAGNAFDAGDAGESISNMIPVSYAALTNAVDANARTAADASVAASLPAASPIGGATYWVTTAQAKALGLAPAIGGELDGSVGFGPDSLFTYTGTTDPGTLDFFGTAVHEITEVMGRQLLTGVAVLGVLDSYTLLDLLHYSAPGVRDLSSATAGYFSPDGGVTNDDAFNTIPSGDAGDWASSVTSDSFDAFATSGVAQAVTANDLTVMDAIGWEPAGSGGAVSPALTASTAAGVAVSAGTGSLASVQVNKGLAAKAGLASFVQSGGPSGDTYSFALGGAGAAPFTLTGATLSVGASVVPGASGGKLYALTVTATDRTTGASSPAVPVNVVVGGNGNDAIQLSSLPGITASAPSFIYGLGGVDTIDGTGMTGTLYFDSGAGADLMTGGGGVNIYEYGAAADSTASALDIIANFNVAVDLIDLTGMNTPFTSTGSLTAGATSIASGTIGWRVAAGNTFVYANTGPRTETLPSANMEIELRGSIALTSGNFAHI